LLKVKQRKEKQSKAKLYPHSVDWHKSRHSLPSYPCYNQPKHNTANSCLPTKCSNYLRKKTMQNQNTNHLFSKETHIETEYIVKGQKTDGVYNNARKLLQFIFILLAAAERNGRS